MADVKISGLPASTVPLAGTEVLPIVQGGATKQVSIANVTVGRAVSANSFTPSSSTIPTNGMYLDATNSVSLAANSLKSVTFRQGGIAGLGTTPQSWYVPGDIISAQQIGANAAVFSLFGNQAIFSSNYYLKTGTGNDTYINTGVATRYIQEVGGHFWDSAASGTADTTVAFTRLLSLPSTGNLKVETGNLVIGTSGKGIDFSATAGTGTSELLADYEEGTWTPTFTSSGATFTYGGTTNANYVKVGGLVTVSAYVNVTSITGTLTNAVNIDGLPFASKTPFSASGVFGVDQFTVRPSLYINNSSTTTISIYQAGTISSMLTASMTASGYYLFTITYQAA